MTAISTYSSIEADVYCAHIAVAIGNHSITRSGAKRLRRKTRREARRMHTTHSIRSVSWLFALSLCCDTRRRFRSAIFRWRSSPFLMGWLILGFALSAATQSANQSVTSLVSKGQTALDSGDFALAASDFEQARQIAPENLAVNRGLLLSYLQGRRLGDAERIGQSSLARFPQDSQLLHWLGLVYFKEGRKPEALEMLGRAEKVDGSQSDIHFDTALVLLSDNQYSAAADELEKAIKLDPKAALPHVLLGRAYQNTNRSVQAIEQFKMALRLDPEIPLGHYHLGFAYASLGRTPEAIAEYKKEILRSPNDSSVLYQLGHCLLATGDWKSAVVDLARVAKVDPQNSDASYDLGKALLLQGDAEGAVLALRHAVALNPGDPAAHYQLSRALEKTGRKEEAQMELQTFSALKKTQPVAGGMAAGPIQ